MGLLIKIHEMNAATSEKIHDRICIAPPLVHFYKIQFDQDVVNHSLSKLFAAPCRTFKGSNPVFMQTVLWGSGCTLPPSFPGKSNHLDQFFPAPSNELAA